MAEIRRLAEHQRAGPGDHLDAVFVTESHRLIGDAAAHAAVHPHAGDARLGAVLDHLRRHLRARDDQHGLHPAGDTLNIRVAGGTADLRRVRIYREHLVARALKALVDHVGRLFFIARNSGHGNAFLGQKITRCRL